MKHWKKTATTALCLLMVSASPALADAPTPRPALPSDVVVHEAEAFISGELTYVDLEGGYYAVDGWMLRGDENLFKPFLGKEVTVSGTVFGGVSVQMVKSLTVNTIRLKSEVTPAKPVAPVPEVIPISLPLDNLKEIRANRPLPAKISVAGRAVAFDQQPVMLDGTLMVPLRFVVEAAGGTVEWDGETQSVTVKLADRTAVFVIGEDQAEMNQKGVFYIQRNMIKMARPTVTAEGRTLISADALTSILGLMERPGQEGTLDLVASPGILAPVESAAAEPIAANAAPRALQEWAAVLGDEPSSKALATEKGIYLAISGGLRNSGGYRVELVGDARHVNGVWVVDAQVVPPSGPATMALTHPVGYFFLPGVEGEVEVRFIAAPLPKADPTK